MLEPVVGWWSHQRYGTDGFIGGSTATTLGITSIKIDKRQLMPKHDVTLRGPLHGVLIESAAVCAFLHQRYTYLFTPYSKIAKKYTVAGGGMLFPSAESAGAVHHGIKNVLALQGFVSHFCVCMCVCVC